MIEKWLVINIKISSCGQILIVVFWIWNVHGYCTTITAVFLPQLIKHSKGIISHSMLRKEGTGSVLYSYNLWKSFENVAKTKTSLLDRTSKCGSGGTARCVLSPARARTEIHLEFVRFIGKNPALDIARLVGLRCPQAVILNCHFKAGAAEDCKKASVRKSAEGRPISPAQKAVHTAPRSVTGNVFRTRDVSAGCGIYEGVSFN